MVGVVWVVGRWVGIVLFVGLWLAAGGGKVLTKGQKSAFYCCGVSAGCFYGLCGRLEFNVFWLLGVFFGVFFACCVLIACFLCEEMWLACGCVDVSGVVVMWERIGIVWDVV